MVGKLDFDEIEASNPQIERQAVEQARALQRALTKLRKRHAQRPGSPGPFGAPRPTSSDDPANDPRVARLPRFAPKR